MMELHFEIEDERTDAMIPVEVMVKYTPGRPAPRCSNPDRAEFSDPGDDSYAEIMWARYPAASGQPGRPIEESLRYSSRFNEHVIRAADESWEKKDF
jgi:hypothetical protein